IIGGRDTRVGSFKINFVYSRVGFSDMPFKIIEKRFPVDTFIAIPMRTARVVVVAEVGMKLAQNLAHVPVILDRNGSLGIAVQIINTLSLLIGGVSNYIALIARP